MKKIITTMLSAVLFFAYTNGQSSVKIGNQEWTSKNLDISIYRNGDVIPQVTDPGQWAGLTTGAWCYYNNDSSNNRTYGKLYNWYAVNDKRGLAPSGWHIPSDVEWTTLTDYLSDSGNVGGKMKAISSLWHSPNTGATNSSGWTGLPGGYCFYNGTFNDVGGIGSWWSASEYDAAFAWYRFLTKDGAFASRYYYNKVNGFSVRCVRD